MPKRVFIVRPFGTREGLDFDAIEARLIQPAIRGVTAAVLEGGTTLPIVEQGNIREDMFRELVTADLVIADLSIHNANVFYELGIRHGLRPHATLLLRADLSTFPFDLQTDRYLKYDPAHPEASVGALIAALDATLSSDRIDSPVYQLLPSLRPPDPAVLRVVPREFGEAVERARVARFRGDLRLLANEARGFPWASEGLRSVGRAQVGLQATPGAVETFEWLRDMVPDDVEANQRLATLYQRLATETADAGEYRARSNSAIQRVIESPVPNSWDRAEAYALKASNIKERWLNRIGGISGAEAQVETLRGAELEESLESYASGFAQDLNHFYSGLNALSLLRIRLDLARRHPDCWASWFESDQTAASRLQEGEARSRQLAGAVKLAIEASRITLDRQRRPDAERRLWTEISAADLSFLIGDRPLATAQLYRRALLSAPSFALTVVRRQTHIFQRLDLRQDFAVETLKVIAELERDQTSPGIVPAPPGRVLLFSGHMIDGPNPRRSRFPPTLGAEQEARRLIEEAVIKERSLTTGALVGIAGGACGGDILFHDVCADLGIPTRLLLAEPKEAYRAHSVQHGGARWVERFDRLCQRVPPRILSDGAGLPAWLRGREGYTIWQRGNLWMLFNALALDARQLTLLALWDKGPAEGPGGTEDFVDQVNQRGYKVEVLPAEGLKTFR